MTGAEGDGGAECRILFSAAFRRNAAFLAASSKGDEYATESPSCAELSQRDAGRLLAIAARTWANEALCLGIT
jgi:hypothetical protein